MINPDFLKLVLFGASMTILISVLSACLGMILGIIFLSFEKFPIKIVSWITTLFLIILRGLPEIVLIFLIYYGGSQLLSNFNINLNNLEAGVIALGIVSGAYASQSLRGAIESIPQGQWQAAKALGLGRVKTFFHIIMPQMWREALPGLTNQWLTLMKDSSLVSVIGVGETMYYTNAVIKVTHQPFVWYIIAALLYLTFTISSNFIIKLLNKRANYYLVKAN